MVKPKNPYKPFNDASQDKEHEESQLKAPLDLNPAIKKDNVNPVPKPPSFAMGGTTNTAPRGTMGYKEAWTVAECVAASSEIDITKGDPEKNLWIHGNITTMDGYSFSAKVYELPSEHGIQGGKISKLEIKDGDRIAVSFDRGWDVKPVTHQDRDALNKIREVFDPPREFKPIVTKSNDKDHGHER